jgi:ATP adenylyltransferase/5',5'''-P-1,P-4-tetraphosphate phosphorylase II
MSFASNVHSFLFLEEIKRDIGYNLIITKSYLMVVPLVDPYEVYNGMKLYLDGLAYLGCVHTAKLAKPYQIVHPTSGG